MTTLEYISDKLFQHINFSAFRADDSHGTIFLSRFNSSYQFHASLNLILKVILHNGFLMFFSDVSYNLWKLYKKLKVAYSSEYNLKHLFMHSLVSLIIRKINFEVVLLVNNCLLLVFPKLHMNKVFFSIECKDLISLRL